MPIISDNYPMKGLFQCPPKYGGLFLFIAPDKTRQSMIIEYDFRFSRNNV